MSGPHGHTFSQVGPYMMDSEFNLYKACVYMCARERELHMKRHYLQEEKLSIYLAKCFVDFFSLKTPSTGVKANGAPSRQYLLIFLSPCKVMCVYYGKQILSPLLSNKVHEVHVPILRPRTSHRTSPVPEEFPVKYKIWEGRGPFTARKENQSTPNGTRGAG